jgi:hypothetical protein
LVWTAGGGGEGGARGKDPFHAGPVPQLPDRLTLDWCGTGGEVEQVRQKWTCHLSSVWHNFMAAWSAHNKVSHSAGSVPGQCLLVQVKNFYKYGIGPGQLPTVVNLGLFQSFHQ